jgi:AcrR family transcriptional regulator
MTAPRGRRQEYAELTRVAVVEAATDLFARHGYARTSLEQVAAAARVSKGAVYGHFSGKEALFVAVLEDQERRMVQHLTELALEQDDPWQGAVAALRAFLEACRDSVYGHIVMREGPSALPYSQWLKCAEPYSLGLTRSLAAGLMDAGLMAPLPLETASRLFHGMLASAAVLIADADEAPDVQARVTDEAVAVVIALARGLLVQPPPGEAP